MSDHEPDLTDKTIYFIIIEYASSDDTMADVLFGFGIVIILFAAGIVLGFFIMKSYYSKRFYIAAQKCMDDDSFEPLIDEMSEIS